MRAIRSVRPADWAAWLVVVAGGAAIAHHALAVVHFVRMRALEGDFALYYVFARIGLRHGWNALYDLGSQRQEWQALGPTLFYPEIYPPPLAWLLSPFALMPFRPAIGIWTILLVTALVGSWWLCAPPTGRSVRAAHLALALALPPVAFGVLLGQVVAFVALAVAAAWWLLRHQRPVAAGLLLTFLAVKPQLAFLVPVALLAAGYRRAVVAFGAGSAAIATVCLVTVGWDGLRTYGSRLVESTHSLATYVVPVQLTVPGLLGSGLAAHLAQLAIVGVLVGACWLRRAQGPEFPLAAGLAASLLVTPFVHAQDLTMLVVAGWLTLRTAAAGWELSLTLAGYLASCLLANPLPLLLVLGAWTGTLIRTRAQFSDPRSPGFRSRAQARRA